MDYSLIIFKKIEKFFALFYQKVAEILQFVV